MNKTDLIIPFSAPLHPEDTEEQTYGCRRRNPNACPNHDLFDDCAFVTEDHICGKPSTRWKRQYDKLTKIENAMVLIVPFSASLNPEDTEVQTYGCRRVEPKDCPYNRETNVCAFVRKDHICKHPSRKWPGMYEELEGRK